ncbi:MAG: prolyl oligopeptidase family serine peptidase [Rhodobacteraceae bacterium]|jgi:phospholipase/carboxylesterase|nr:phospholipase [Paracoccaceae bacterium]MBT4777259.1 prolyl oligopeptidase family serine peptidase [Paracoccaceae bacterium]|tara:strand:- start:12593 stop:13258 length:666 start_codon:yes stop_codon:yes gene_type:complete
MTVILDSNRVNSRSGVDSSLVIFLHGYGANGNDLLGLADQLSEHLPDTVFLAPDAPETCSVNPGGFQWFPIPWIDGSTEEESERGLLRATEDLQMFIKQSMEEEGLSEAETILIGFSQGTMMALHVGPRMVDSILGIIGFSGRILNPESLLEDCKSKPPTLLIHGDQDDVVPFSSLSTAESTLQECGFEVETHVMEGTGHGISPDGLLACLNFILLQLDLV